MLRPIRFSLVTLVLAFSAFFGASAASAQVPTLQGELLQGSGFLFEDPFNPGPAQPPNCNPSGTSTMQYEEVGVATGPYPGTFEERGTVQLGPQSPVAPTSALVPGTLTGTVVRFQASFTILSGATRITGTKELTATLFGVPRTSEGSCFSASAPNGGDFGYPQLADFTIRMRRANVSFRYEATIESPLGTYRDSGEGFHRFDEGAFRGSCNVPGGACPVIGQIIHNGFYSQGGMQEFFYRSFGLEDPAPATVVLTPPTAINNVGTTHTVTATVATSAGTPAANVTVLFDVMGSVNTTGECTTNAQGRCDFTYQGPDFPGADVITGCADSNGNDDVDAGEPCGEATKIWLLPATVPGQVTGGGWITMDGGRVSFGFNAQADEAGGAAKGNCNVIDHATKMQIKCLTVDSLVVTPTHATFFGQARVDGATTDYRIDVDDLGEPGLADTFKIQLDNGYTAGGTLKGGNIQIHR